METTYNRKDTNAGAEIADGVERSLKAGADTAKSAMNTIADAAKDVTKKATEARDTVSHFIETRPLTAVVIALGVGVLLSRCVRR